MAKNCVNMGLFYAPYDYSYQKMPLWAMKNEK